MPTRENEVFCPSLSLRLTNTYMWLSDHGRGMPADHQKAAGLLLVFTCTDHAAEHNEVRVLKLALAERKWVVGRLRRACSCVP